MWFLLVTSTCFTCIYIQSTCVSLNRLLKEEKKCWPSWWLSVCSMYLALALWKKNTFNVSSKNIIDCRVELIWFFRQKHFRHAFYGRLLSNLQIDQRHISTHSIKMHLIKTFSFVDSNSRPKKNEWMKTPTKIRQYSLKLSFLTH